MLERYELLEELGRGAQGVTHKARDTETGAIVAIKELDFDAVEDWKSVELFEREARVLKSIEHAHIPNYIDTFTLEQDGTLRLFLVQEHVSGMDLASRLKREGTWSMDQAQDALEALLPALEHIHQRVPPIVHRDIKPSNILEDADDELFLIDFGAVQDERPSTVGGSTVIGTPGYMPTEQMIGRAAPTSDLYSLGVTLCHMVTGLAPTEVDLDKHNKLDYAAHLPAAHPLTPLLLEMIEPTQGKRPESARTILDAISGPARRPHPVDLQARAASIAEWDTWARSQLEGYRIMEVYRGTGDTVRTTNEAVTEQREHTVGVATALGWTFEGSYETWPTELTWALDIFLLNASWALLKNAAGDTWSDGEDTMFTFFDDGTCVVTGARIRGLDDGRFEHHEVSASFEVLASAHASHVARRTAQGARPLVDLSPERANLLMLGAKLPAASPLQAAAQGAFSLFMWTMLFLVFIPFLISTRAKSAHLANFADVHTTRTVDEAFTHLPSVELGAQPPSNTTFDFDVADAHAEEHVSAS